MYIVNHFLDINIFSILIPNILRALKTNATKGPGSISKQADLCLLTWKRPLNVILVDYSSKGRFLRPF